MRLSQQKEIICTREELVRASKAGYKFAIATLAQTLGPLYQHILWCKETRQVFTCKKEGEYVVSAKELKELQKIMKGEWLW